jgi:ankyrin repeat protein
MFDMIDKFAVLSNIFSYVTDNFADILKLSHVDTNFNNIIWSDFHILWDNIITRKNFQFGKIFKNKDLAYKFCYFLHKTDNVNIQDKNDDTALLCATIKGNKECVEILLRHPDINVNKEVRYGYRALVWGIKCKNKECVKMLLKHPDIDVNVKDNGSEPILVYSVLEQQAEYIELLLNHPKINANIESDWTGTPLIYAVKIEYIEGIELLLKHSNINTTSDGFLSALQLAKKKNKKIYDLFENL